MYEEYEPVSIGFYIGPRSILSDCDNIGRYMISHNGHAIADMNYMACRTICPGKIHGRCPFFGCVVLKSIFYEYFDMPEKYVGILMDKDCNDEVIVKV